jgi:hypothetical protein
VTRCGGVTTSTGVEAAPGKGKRVDDVSWADTNLTKSKIKKNPRGRFNCFKWMVKI